MKVYTYSQARQSFAAVLEEARRLGRVAIRRRDGQTFILRPETKMNSPLDVPGLDLNLSRDEIVAAVRESRKSRVCGRRQSGYWCRICSFVFQLRAGVHNA